MRKLLGLGIILLLLVPTLSSFVTISQVRARNFKTITVPDDYSTIQKAIDIATAGDTIYVKAGIYRENIVVNKAVLILGEGSNNTVIEGNFQDVPVVKIVANDVILTDFTIRNSGKQIYPGGGIHVQNSVNVKILRNNIIEHSERGIFLNNS
ncbi:MAG: right-handed parallel beta-helix repeat-containing protein, partial [Nitrososphaerales archaeon]